MKQEVENFVKLYNERMSWNRDIRSTLNMDYINSHPYMKKIIDDYLCVEEINEDNTDLENAMVYEYDPNDNYLTSTDDLSGTLEMQAYSKETYRTRYFWVKPLEDEKSYKENKIKNINKKLDEDISEMHDELKELQSVYDELCTLKAIIK